MSVTLTWKPHKPAKRVLDIGWGSDFCTLMRNRYGFGGPWVVGNEDIEFFKGLAAAHPEGSDGHQGFHEIVGALGKHGAIEIVAEW